jgi:hypothetical protein
VYRVFIALDHTQTHTTVGGTPLDERSACHGDLYLTTQTLYKRQTSMPPVGFEPMILASAQLQTYALDRAVTGIGKNTLFNSKIILQQFYLKWSAILADELA